MQQKLKPLRIMIIVYAVFTAIFIALKSRFKEWGFDTDILVTGNTVLFLISLVSFRIVASNLRAKSPHAFVRAIYTSFILKFFAIAIAAFVYILLEKNGVNKPSLFGCMLLYMIYTAIEVSVLTKMLKQNKHA